MMNVCGHTIQGLACLLLYRKGKEVFIMYSILYIIGAIVVLIIVLRLLGLY
jgi:hypothetical protein